MPVNAASVYGIGLSPTGVELGSRVLGMFLDGNNKTKPMIVGTFPVTLDGTEGNHSVSRIARGISPVKKNYTELEPKSKYKARYPFNKTLTTKSGHVIEIDDTPKSERIHIYHKSGTYIEMFPDGSLVTKSADNTEIVVGEKTSITTGNISIVSNDGEINIIASGNINVVSKDGEITLSAPMINING